MKKSTVSDLDPNDRFWCSTKVDENKDHVSGGGFWGYCSESCPPFDVKKTKKGE